MCLVQKVSYNTTDILRAPPRKHKICLFSFWSWTALVENFLLLDTKLERPEGIKQLHVMPKMCYSSLSLAVGYNSWIREHKPLGKINLSFLFLDICFAGVSEKPTCRLHQFSTSVFLLLWLHWENSHFGKFWLLRCIKPQKRSHHLGNKSDPCSLFIEEDNDCLYFLNTNLCNWRIPQVTNALLFILGKC